MNLKNSKFLIAINEIVINLQTDTWKLDRFREYSATSALSSSGFLRLTPRLNMMVIAGNEAGRNTEKLVTILNEELVFVEI